MGSVRTESPLAMASIYKNPAIYDLEHASAEPDVPFFTALVKAHRPRRILEYACGNGRVTLPIAEACAEWGGTATGLDTAEAMLESARKRDSGARVSWVNGDLTSWRPAELCDFLFAACSSLSHLTTLEKQLEAWRNAFGSLTEGGRFVVAEVMPDYRTLADSMHSPPRATICLDGDFEKGAERMLRCRAAQFRADTQRMKVHYFYDRASAGNAERFLDDYEAHVYFPNELQLLFLSAGFEIEAVWGDYHRGPLRHDSRAMIICGRKVSV